MSRLRAWAGVVDDVMAPVVDPLERLMRWVMARWYRVVALVTVEAAGFAVLIWGPWR